MSSIIYGRRHPSVSGTPRPNVRTLMMARLREAGSFCNNTLLHFNQHFWNISTFYYLGTADKLLKKTSRGTLGL